MKKVEIYKVEYTISTRREENWIAFVAAYDVDSAVKYVNRFVRNGRVIVNAISTMCRLDGVTDNVRKLIAQPLLPVGKPEEEKEEEDETKPQKRSIVPKE